LRVAGSTLALPSCSGDAPAAVWLEHLERLSGVGFDAVDLVDTWLSPAALAPSALSDLREAISQARLALVGVSVIRKSIIDPVDGEANLEHTLASVDAVETLGAPVLCIGFQRPLTEQQTRAPFWLVDAPRDALDERTYELAVERLQELCRCAARSGIEISLELYEGTLLGTGARAAQLVHDVGAPNLGTNPDLANLYRQPHKLDETWEETLTACIPTMNYWHVKNYRRVYVTPDGPITTFPETLARGDINYRLAIELVVAGGFRGPLSVEHYGGDQIAAQAAGRVYLESIIRSR
jgi:sugar phosphate isomerase/epimerase